MSTSESTARELAGKLITFLETGAAPGGLFAPDVFVDFTMPQWRLQSQAGFGGTAPHLPGSPVPWLLVIAAGVALASGGFAGMVRAALASG